MLVSSSPEHRSDGVLLLTTLTAPSTLSALSLVAESVANLEA